MESKVSTPKKGISTSDVIIIPESFFQNQNVFLFINNLDFKEKLAKKLEEIGAFISENMNYLNDIIISEKPVETPEKMFRKLNSNRFINALNIKEKTPKNILLQQIPWAYGKSKKLTHVSIGSELKIVIADIEGKYLPKYKILNIKPTLYYGNTPKGYYFSPFIPLPDDFTNFIQKNKNHSTKNIVDVKNFPSDNQYCGLCKCKFENAERHHQTEEHIYHANNMEEWEKFDNLSYIMSKSFLSSN